MKKYSSFKEIDKDLKLLKLRSQIARQKASIDLAYIRTDLSFSNVFSEIVANLGKKYIYKQIYDKLLSKLGIRK